MNIFSNLTKSQKEKDSERMEYYRQKRIQQQRMQNIYNTLLSDKKERRRKK